MVSIGAYYIKLEADSWWKTVKESYLAKIGFGWTKYSTKLKERFYRDELHWQKKEVFLFLSKGSLLIQECTDRFIALSHFTTSGVPTEYERVKTCVKRWILELGHTC